MKCLNSKTFQVFHDLYKPWVMTLVGELDKNKFVLKTQETIPENTGYIISGNQEKKKESEEERV